MRILLAMLIASTLLISGCYHQTIQQGNIIASSQTSKIKRGMSKQQVISLLGSPVLRNMYQDNRLVYVYTLEKKHNQLIKKQFIVEFRHGRVVSAL